MNAERLVNIVIMVTVFGLVFSIWCLCVIVWLGQYLMRLKAVQKRLGIVEKETDESKTLRLWRALQQTSIPHKKVPIEERLERLRYDAGWQGSVQMILLGLAGAVVLAFVITYAIGGGLLLSLAAAAVVIVIFSGYTQKQITRRAALFERQLVDALGVAARALRAGHPLVGAFELVAEEIGQPLGNIFYKICQEQSLGLDLNESIHKLASTTRNTELKFFATAVAIQFKSGGNLADLMDSLASVIRSRIRLNQHIRVITAQTQFSKRVLIALPIILFLLLSRISPTYMEPFYTTVAGKYLLAAAVCIVLFGWWVMKRLAVVRF